MAAAVLALLLLEAAASAGVAMERAASGAVTVVAAMVVAAMVANLAGITVGTVAVVMGGVGEADMDTAEAHTVPEVQRHLQVRPVPLPRQALLASRVRAISQEAIWAMRRAVLAAGVPASSPTR